MGAGASADSSAATLAAVQNVDADTAAKLVEDAVATVPPLHQENARLLFSCASETMTSDEISVAAKEVLATVKSVDMMEDAQSLLVKVGAVLSTTSGMAPEVTANVGRVLYGVAEHLVRHFLFFLCRHHVSNSFLVLW